MINCIVYTHMWNGRMLRLLDSYGVSMWLLCLCWSTYIHTFVLNQPKTYYYKHTLCVCVCLSVCVCVRVCVRVCVPMHISVGVNVRVGRVACWMTDSWPENVSQSSPAYTVFFQIFSEIKICIYREIIIPIEHQAWTISLRLWFLKQNHAYTLCMCMMRVQMSVF